MTDVLIVFYKKKQNPNNALHNFLSKLIFLPVDGWISDGPFCHVEIAFPDRQKKQMRTWGIKKHLTVKGDLNIRKNRIHCVNNKNFENKK